MKKVLLATLLALSVSNVAFADDIIDSAKADGSLKTLLTAIQAAGLTDTLKGDGPFTVFAPTDDAFKKLPAGTVEELLKDLPKLKAVLTYHVVAGKHLAEDITKLTTAKTIEGRNIQISQKNGGVKINEANITKADVETTNGVIHIIDTVLLPE